MEWEDTREENKFLDCLISVKLTIPLSADYQFSNGAADDVGSQGCYRYLNPELSGWRNYGMV